MKKLLAIILSCLMLCGLAVPAFAAESTVSDAQVETLLETAVSALTGETVVDLQNADWLIEEIKTYADGAVTPQDVADVMSKYLIIDRKDAGDLAQEIVDDCKFFNSKLDDGTYTVKIVINVYKHPELYRYRVFRETIDRLYEKQYHYVINDGSEYNMMTYRHIAGETVLHMILYVLVKGMLGDKTWSPLYKLYKKAYKIDLNVDEHRVPPILIEIAGFLATTFIDAIRNALIFC